MKKNIWVINQHCYPLGESNWTRHYDLFNKFNQEDWNIEIIGGSFVHDRRRQILKNNEKFQIKKIDNLNYHILSGKTYKSSIYRVLTMIEFMFKSIFYAKKIKNIPDIIYSSTPHPFNCLAGIYLAKKYKCKHIVEVRDVWPETWVDMGKMTKKNIIYKIFAVLEKYIYKKADAIITLTSNKNHYLELGIPEEKVHLVSNGVDIEKFDYNLANYKQDILPKNKFNIVYTGSIGIANALEVVIEAAEILKENKDIHFNLIGEGELKNTYIGQVNEKKLNNISFYHAVEKKYIPSILKNSNLLIVALKNVELYKKNGISLNKIFEYLSSEKVIILAGYPDNDLIKISNSGLSIEPENSKAFVEAIMKIYFMSTTEREELEKNGRKYVEENFDWKILSKKVENIIINIV